MSGTVVPIGSWTRPLIWELEATFCGDVQIPFTQYVYSAPAEAPSPSFLLFLMLPLELQRQIIGFCDTSTLFRLMQVCSFLRKETLHLFWSDPEVWYTVDGSWLLAGGYTGHTDCSIDGLKYIQRVVVDFADLDPLHAGGWDDGICAVAENFSEHDRTARIHTFWQTFQHRFPSAVHVVLSEAFPLPENAPLPSDHQRLVEEGPQSLYLGLSFLVKEKASELRPRRVLWQYSCSGHDNKGSPWNLTASPWIQRIIKPPVKQFHGPVGAYSRYRYRENQWILRNGARRLLMLQAVESHCRKHSKFQFTCPNKGCSIVFDAPGQWTAHAIETKHDANMELPTEDLQIAFAQHDSRMGQFKKQNESDLLAMKTIWGYEGSNQRRFAEQSFLAQL